MNHKKPDEAHADTFSEAIGTAGEFLSDPEAIKEAAANAADLAADYIRKHPFQAIGVSFAAGILAGLFINQRK
jgi:ElaB/YqjD/DUF883 family membrane-anchored ribosome-binding protein